MLNRFEDRILADSRFAAEDQCMIDLLKGPLRPVRQPVYDMISVSRIDFSNEIKPWRYIARNALDAWRSVKVKDPTPRPINPATFGNQLIVDQRRLSWRPCRLLDGCILV
jgi:hypothetical protein